jgi:hypothetical protein
MWDVYGESGWGRLKQRQPDSEEVCRLAFAVEEAQRRRGIYAATHSTQRPTPVKHLPHVVVQRIDDTFRPSGGIDMQNVPIHLLPFSLFTHASLQATTTRLVPHWL